MNKLQLAENLFSKMQEKKSQWEKLQNIIMPSAVDAANLNENQTEPRKGTYSSVANLSLHILASAHLTYITPMDQRWFSLKSKLQGKEASAAADEWFAIATEKTYKALADSNFYSVIHEVYLDRCLTGIGCAFAEITQTGSLLFTYVPTGTYAIAEGADGEIDTLVRKIKLTPHQAAQNFGLASLPESIQAHYNDEKKRYTETSEYYHLVTPNQAYSFGSLNTKPENRRWTDSYIHIQSKQIVQENGFYEFPFLVTRYLKKGSVYGYAPATAVIPEIESALILERIMDTIGQNAAIPRILHLANQVGEIDLRAGGRTLVTPEAASMNLPREWATSGRYDIGIARLQGKEEKIKQAFHVQMLQVISSVDRQMTATEVNARESEKAMSFTPSFTLFISDFRPFMQRIFALLYRANTYDTANTPEELLHYSADRTKAELAVPQIRYMGKIAQAVERVQRYGLEGSLSFMSNLMQITQDPSMIETLNPYEIVKFMWDASGAPTDCLKTKKEYQALQQQKAQQAQALQQLQALETISKTQTNNQQPQQ